MGEKMMSTGLLLYIELGTNIVDLFVVSFLPLVLAESILQFNWCFAVHPVVHCMPDLEKKNPMHCALNLLKAEVTSNMSLYNYVCWTLKYLSVGALYDLQTVLFHHFCLGLKWGCFLFKMGMTLLWCHCAHRTNQWEMGSVWGAHASDANYKLNNSSGDCW